MPGQLKKYSRSQAAKIMAYGVLIICISLISNLLCVFLYDYNGDLEVLINERYYNSAAYYNEVAQAFADTCDLLLLPEGAGLPARDYYYEAYGYGKGYGHRNFELGQKQYFNGYLYGWRHGEVYAARLDADGLTQPLPFAESGIIPFLETQASEFSLEQEGYPPNNVYVIFSDELLAARQQAWEAERVGLLHSAERLLLVLLLIVPLVMYLALVTGRRPEDERLHPGVLDNLPSDVLLLLFLLAVLGGSVIWFESVNAVRRQLNYTQNGLPAETLQLLSLALAMYAGLLVCAALLLFNALMRKIKARRLLKHSLLYRLVLLAARPLASLGRAMTAVLKKLGAGGQSAWRQFVIGPDYEGGDPAEGMFYRQRRFLIITAAAVLLLILFLLLNIIPLFLLTLLAEAVVVYFFLRGNQKDMAAVKMSVEKSLDEQMRLEKLKVELVTNVSHDLKTPLTSIISYVELLSKEQGLSPLARDYVQVLGEKSRRLDRIVSDLFELAKASSGNIPLEMEVLDIKRLFEQTMADMEDRIEASGLTVRLRLPEHSLMVLTDGNRLYRVLQNVLDNALKYSLAGSRVFVELTEKEGRASGVVKNTAAYEMNFSTEDVLRRFSRGDKARSSEGSGLGLAIAKSFCERCGGQLSVSIDGDQFKVSVDFPLAAQ